jgi:hypothetical protein
LQVADLVDVYCSPHLASIVIIQSGRSPSQLSRYSC